MQSMQLDSSSKVVLPVVSYMKICPNEMSVCPTGGLKSPGPLPPTLMGICISINRRKLGLRSSLLNRCFVLQNLRIATKIGNIFSAY